MSAEFTLHTQVVRQRGVSEKATCPGRSIARSLPPSLFPHFITGVATVGERGWEEGGRQEGEWREEGGGREEGR